MQTQAIETWEPNYYFTVEASRQIERVMTEEYNVPIEDVEAIVQTYGELIEVYETIEGFRHNYVTVLRQALCIKELGEAMLIGLPHNKRGLVTFYRETD